MLALVCFGSILNWFDIRSVRSSLKIATWLPLPWTRRRPLATRGIAHSTRTGNSHSFHPDISHPGLANVLPYPDVSQPPFYPVDIPLSPDVSQPPFYPVDVPLSPDISHPAPVVGWERRTIQLPRTDTSGSSSNAYPDSLARQTLAICRIHFRPQ